MISTHVKNYSHFIEYINANIALISNIHVHVRYIKLKTISNLLFNSTPTGTVV